MLKNKCIVIGVTGSIAAYKAAELTSWAKKQHADVNVIMTKNAHSTAFVLWPSFLILLVFVCVSLNRELDREVRRAYTA